MKKRYNPEYAPNYLKIYTHFLEMLLSNINPASSLIINALNENLIEEFPLPPESQYEKKSLDWVNKNLEPDRQNYDFLYGEFPMGVRSAVVSKAIKADIGFNINTEWYYIFNTIKYLSKNGLAVFPVIPAIFYPHKGRKFLEFIEENGFYIDATFELPAIFSPQTELCPYLVSIRRGMPSNYFIANIQDVENHSSVISNYLRKHDAGSLAEGTIVQKGNFISFPKYRADSELKILQKQFSEFKQALIKDVAIAINQVYKDKKFTHKPNSVYFPKIGNSGVVCHIEDCSIQHKNYYQIELSDQILSDYFSYIFKSELGNIIRETLKVGMFIERVPKELLENTTIPLPDLKTQREVLGESNKIRILKDKLALIEKELSISPLDYNNLLNEQIHDLIQVAELESNAQKIRRLVRKGESKTLELKQSFSLDVKEQKKETNKKEYLEDKCLTTIVGFLNTDGGKLIVGVKDNGEFSGLEIEISKFHKGSKDKFLQYLQNRIKDRIGVEYSPYINYETIEVDKNCTVLLVNCEASETECYLDRESFYVRTNPATLRLKGPELVKYVRKRFK
jgi:hypothetical protein